MGMVVLAKADFLSSSTQASDIKHKLFLLANKQYFGIYKAFISVKAPW